MNKELIGRRIAEIEETRRQRKGRYTKAERAELDRLGAQLEGEEMTDETEATEAPAVREGMARVEIACDNLCVPWGEHTKLCYQGDVVEVPASFADEMGERVKVL